MGFKQHISRTWQMIEQQVNDVPFRPGYEAARRRVSFEEAPLACAEEKRKRVCARGERRMQRMEHCHDWAEKEQCDRSRESRKENKNPTSNVCFEVGIFVYRNLATEIMAHHFMMSLIVSIVS